MKKHSLFFLCILLTVLFSTCKKKGDRLPLVTTMNASALSDNEISSGGVVYFQGDASILERGLCWSEQPEPTVDDNRIEAGAEEGNFSKSITGLSANKTYYVRAYATNELGTSYGEIKQVSTFPPGVLTVRDFDGNLYHTIKIGSKIWTRENLKVTHYRNGDPINLYYSASSWTSTFLGGYCVYNNYSGYASTYGYLYNWFAVNDPRSIAPAGWHVATYADYMDLIQNANGSSYAASNMKSVTYDWYSNYGSTNNTGFSALPGGQRSAFNGDFALMAYKASFWTKTSTNPSLAIYFDLSHNSSAISNYSIDLRTGLSVRLVKD